MDAIRSGFVQVARRLFKDDLKCCNARDQMGRSAIHFAAQVHFIFVCFFSILPKLISFVQAGNTESIDFLLDECRININCESGDLSRPLHFAAREGHCKIILHLLRRDADPLLTDSYGRTGIVLLSIRVLNCFPCKEILILQWFYKKKSCWPRQRIQSTILFTSTRKSHRRQLNICIPLRWQ